MHGHNDIWFTNFEETKIYLDSIIENEKKLGSWISAQVSNFKTKKSTMSDINVYNTWKEFINNEKYSKYFLEYDIIWYENFNNLKQFIIDNNKLPDSNNKQLSQWLSNQKTLYKNNEGIMLDETIKKIWEEFINEEKYSKYFLEYDIIWYENFNNLKQFIIDNNKLPDSNNKQLSQWLSNQKTLYKNNEGIMLDETIKKIWEEFINEYNFFSINIIQSNLDQLFYKQRSSCKNNNNAMKDDSIKTSLEHFLNDYQQYFPNNIPTT